MTGRIKGAVRDGLPVTRAAKSLASPYTHPAEVAA
jgi:hypothetical protein